MIQNPPSGSAKAAYARFLPVPGVYPPYTPTIRQRQEPNHSIIRSA